MPVSPPIPNIGRNAMVKSIGTLKRIEPPQSEMKNALKIITDGIEISSVVVWKNALTARAHARQPHVMRPHDERQESDHEHRKNQRFVTPERFARIIGQNFCHNAECRQNQHVNLRVAEEPEQMLPQKRAAAAADICRRAIHDQAGWEEEAGVRHPIH